MLEGMFGQTLNYDLWLLALTLAFSSSIVFFKLYYIIRGTPLGKVAFFMAINSFLWSMAIAVLSVPAMTMVGIYTDIFLVVTVLAGVASTVAAYYRAIVHGLLTPGNDGKSPDLRIYYVLCGLAFAIAFIMVIGVTLNISFLKTAMNGRSILGDLGIISLLVSLFLLARPKTQNKLAYLGIILAFTIGCLVLLGNWFLIRFLVRPFHSGTTSELTALGLVAASLTAVLSKRHGLRTWTVQFIPATAVLLIAILALIGYIINLSTLYNGGVYVSMPIPTAVCFLLIGMAQVWYAWRRP